MGKDPDREPPFFFTKPADALVDNNAAVPYPSMTRDFQYEVELVVGIVKGGKGIKVEAALNHVFGYAVGIDLTRRDLQLQARDKGRPWDWGKAFDMSAPCAPLVPVHSGHHPSKGRIWLAVNGVVKQNADIADLIWPVPDIIAHISEAMTLMPGDLIFTGTPAGVGPLVVGDRMTGGIDGVGTIDIRVAAAE
jgi:fumarylpyruvate hydrolase